MPAPATGSGGLSTRTDPKPPVQPDPQSAVKLITAMFMPNPGVPLQSTGKPLGMSGSWGMQVKFPEGLPDACMMARVPCVRVVYRVPADQVICTWLVGFVPFSEHLANGEVERRMRPMVLEEDTSAAKYTLKKDWSYGERRPRPVATQRPEYPAIARATSVNGVVTMRVEVGPDGKVTSAEATSGPKLLQPASLAAVRQFRYKPLVLGAEPTTFRTEERFQFGAAAVPALGEGMGTGGVTMLPQTDPHYDPGFRSEGAAGNQWQSCTAVSCSLEAPTVPQ